MIRETGRTMEAVKLWSASQLTRTRTRAGGDGVNCASRRRRSLQNVEHLISSCSSSSGIVTKKREENYHGVFGRGSVQHEPGVSSSSRGSLLLQRESRARARCRSNDERAHASPVLVLSEEEIESLRKETLDGSYLVEGFETEVVQDEEYGEGKGKDVVEVLDDKKLEGRDEQFSGRQAGRGARLYTMVRWEEEVVENQQPETKSWGLNLDVRRMLTPRSRGILLLNVLTFLYGSNISIIKNAGTTMDPTLFSVGRFAIASLVFAPFLSPALTKKGLRKASVELGLLASAGYLTQCVSVLTSDASRVSFISTFTVLPGTGNSHSLDANEDFQKAGICSQTSHVSTILLVSTLVAILQTCRGAPWDSSILMVIVVPLFAGLTGAKISKITWFSAAAALVGVGILESNGAPFAIGDVWSFVSAVMFGIHILRTEHHSKTLSRDDSLPIMALQLVVITICSSLWSCASHLKSGDFVLNIHASNWPSVWERIVTLPWVPMLYTGLLSTAFCLWTELVSMRDVKATEAAVIYTTEPLWGAAFAWVTLGERWGPNGWLGAFFILGGSLTMQLFGRSDTPAPKKVYSIPLSVDSIPLSVDPSAEDNLEFEQRENREREKHMSSVQIQGSRVEIQGPKVQIQESKTLRMSRTDN